MFVTADVACDFKVLPSLTKSQVSHLARLHFFMPTISLFGRMLCVGAGAGSFERISLFFKLGGRLYATNGGCLNVSFSPGSLFTIVRWCLPTMAGTDRRTGW